ncbi:hypothetical protein Tco_1328217 [Tanacetum coccineum]
METQKPLLKDEDGKEVDEHKIPSHPKVSHLHAVKMILVQETDNGSNSTTKAAYVTRLQVAVDIALEFRIQLRN